MPVFSVWRLGDLVYVRSGGSGRIGYIGWIGLSVFLVDFLMRCFWNIQVADAHPPTP